MTVMRDSIPDSLNGGESQAVDRIPGEHTPAYDRGLALLRQAMVDTGWTIDALAAHLGKDRSLVARILSGDKPLTFERVIAFPDDLEARFARLQAESFGLIVVEPLSGAEAHRAFVSGLFGILAPATPKAAMAKATLRPPMARAERA